MIFLLQTIKKYPLSSILFVVIWYLSFFTPPQTELAEVAFIDKWVHIIMYGGTCMVLWAEYTHKHLTANYRKLFLWAWLAPIVMSGVIELLQEYCTNGRRTGDWLDLAANAAGATLAAAIGLLYLHFRAKR